MSAGPGRGPPARGRGPAGCHWAADGLPVPVRRAERLTPRRARLATPGPRSGNDYLGLATHAEVRGAAAAAARAHGMGRRGSALVCGYSPEHAALERELAELKGAEACLLFPTGFAANSGVLAALAGSDRVTVFSDALNHASIVDGARLAAKGGAALQVYRHKDLGHLRELLAACRTPLKLVVTDTMFSMDGDTADLRGLAALKAEHDFLLVADEAHGTLVFGRGAGGGVAQLQGAEAGVDVHVGTLSKAFGCLGGFAACSRPVRELLATKARPFVFSTALPLPVVAAARAALRVARRDGDALRAKLFRNINLLRNGLGLGGSSSPIVPLVLGTEARALAASAALRREGFHVTAIRPPTVPPGTARLRVALSAAHTTGEVLGLVDALRRLGLTPAAAAAGPGLVAKL